MAEQQEQQGQQAELQRQEQPEPEPKPAPKPKLVFGDPFDRQTSDDTDQGWGGSESGEGRGLDWYLSQRPPHHGG